MRARSRTARSTVNRPVLAQAGQSPLVAFGSTSLHSASLPPSSRHCRDQPSMPGGQASRYGSFLFPTVPPIEPCFVLYLLFRSPPAPCLSSGPFLLCLAQQTAPRRSGARHDLFHLHRCSLLFTFHNITSSSLWAPSCDIVDPSPDLVPLISPFLHLSTTLAHITLS